MGAAYPELHRASALIRETLARGGGEIPLAARARRQDCSTRKIAKLGARPDAARRNRVQALRHLRLPARPDAGRAPPQRARVDAAGFDEAMAVQKKAARAAWAGSGDAASEAVWFDLRDRVGATEFLGYVHEAAEGVILAIVKDGKEVSEAGARRRGRDHRQPVAVLCGIGRTGRRRRRDFVRGRIVDRGEGRQEARRRAQRPSWTDSQRRSEERRRGQARDRRRAPRQDSRATIRRRICCTRRSATFSGRMSRRRARSSRPTASDSISRR